MGVQIETTSTGSIACVVDIGSDNVPTSGKTEEDSGNIVAALDNTAIRESTMREECPILFSVLMRRLAAISNCNPM